VFSGMLGVTFFGLVLTPVFYVVIQKLVERKVGAAQQFALQPAHDEESRHV
jgi:gold/copper resistance efflux pump